MPVCAPAFAMLVAILASAPAEPVSGQERIESIAIAGSGKAGAVETTPVVLGGARTRYEFGRGGCKGRIDAEVLEHMIEAMRTRAPVRIDAIVSGKQRCLIGVTFFAPDP